MSDDSDHPVATTVASTLQVVVLVVVIAVTVTFALINSQRVEVDFLWAETEAPLIAVLVAAAAAGGLIVTLLRLRRR